MNPIIKLYELSAGSNGLISRHPINIAITVEINIEKNNKNSKDMTILF
jgi:hypothetical protein